MKLFGSRRSCRLYTSRHFSYVQEGARKRHICAYRFDSPTYKSSVEQEDKKMEMGSENNKATTTTLLELKTCWSTIDT